MLPSRSDLLPLAVTEAVRVDPAVQPKDENTVLTSAAFGGLNRWFNETHFKERPRAFAYSDNIIMREMLDQAYRPSHEYKAFMESLTGTPCAA